LTFLCYHAVIGSAQKGDTKQPARSRRHAAAGEALPRDAPGHAYRRDRIKDHARRIGCEGAMSHKASLFSGAKAEITEIHAFFVHWFIEASVDTHEFKRLEESFDAEFAMVTPDGKLHTRAEVLLRLHKAKASMEKKFAIDIEEITLLWDDGDAVLVGYVEAQSIGGRHTRRRSTALFEKRDATANGVAWRHLHETWVEVTESARG
jgi:hypothetical protein